jgi:hypothetical protein
VVIQELDAHLRLSKAEDAETGYEMMKVLYDRRIMPTSMGCAT